MDTWGSTRPSAVKQLRDEGGKLTNCQLSPSLLDLHGTFLVLVLDLVVYSWVQDSSIITMYIQIGNLREIYIGFSLPRD